MEALRRRVAERGAGARPSAGADGQPGPGGGNVAAVRWPGSHERGDVQYRGERVQLDNELPRDLRLTKAKEASQIHFVVPLGGGDASSSAGSFAASGGQNGSGGGFRGEADSGSQDGIGQGEADHTVARGALEHGLGDAAAVQLRSAEGASLGSCGCPPVASATANAARHAAWHGRDDAGGLGE